MMLPNRPEVSEEDRGAAPIIPETPRSQREPIRFQLSDKTLDNYGEVADSDKAKRITLSKENFLQKDGVLLRITRGSHDPAEALRQRVVVPHNSRLPVLRMAHEGLGEHPGVKRTTQLLQPHFFRPGLQKGVKASATSCHPCPVSGNYRQLMLRASLQLIPSISVTELTQFFYWYGFLATFQKDEGSHFMAEESRPLTILIIHFWLHHVQAGIPNCGVYLNFFQTWDKLQTQENELSGMGSSLEHLGSYCADQKFPLTFLKDRNPLTYLTELRNGNKGLMRWGIDLQNYNWKVKRLKNSGDRDVFSRH
ncbi:uncharacterized protein [Palaemon carinicauda]|uniref:uncharacterized protein n=1 Tax=Palaemon carinicauda TaxID=392227 RepID=UPI0035B5E2F6